MKIKTGKNSHQATGLMMNVNDMVDFKSRFEDDSLLFIYAVFNKNIFLILGALMMGRDCVKT